MKSLSVVKKALNGDNDSKRFLSEITISLRKKHNISKEFPFVEYNYL